MHPSVPFDAFLALGDLRKFEATSYKDAHTLVVMTQDVLMKFLRMRGNKTLCERVASTAVRDTLDLADTAMKYGVKKFLGDASPLGGYIEQLKAVQSWLDQHNIGTLATLFQSKDQVNAQIDSVIQGLSGAYSSAKQTLLHSSSDTEPPFDLYEEKGGNRGGFSEVMVGEWRPLTSNSFQKVAVKHIRPKGIDLSTMSDAEVRERMLKVHDCSEKLFHHPTLDLTLPLAQTMIYQDNILVNDIHEAVISDFGLSKIVNEGPSGFTTEPTGHGAVLYMSPEQHEDTTAQVTIAIDIYAFTLVALEARPSRDYHGLTSGHSYATTAVQGGERPVPEDHPNLPCDELWELFARGWHEIPSVRPSLDIFIHRLNSLAECRLGSRPPPFETTVFNGSSSEDELSRSASSNKIRLLFPGLIFDVWQGTFTLPNGKFVPAAIKCVRGTKTAMKSERFDREADIRLDLHHPNLLPLLQVRYNPEKCLISPWCENGNLEDYLRNSPNADKMGLVADALDYLHTKDTPIIHGNLSPENICVDGTGKVLISGFSKSVQLSSSTPIFAEMAWPALQEIREEISNMRYLAPEMVNGQDWSTASDVYTFALVILEVLSGKKPFPFVTSRKQLVVLISRGEGPSYNDYWAGRGPHDRLWPYLQQWWSPYSKERPTAGVIKEALGAYSR
ncbi:hypothetical protein FRB99_001722, partial [Tulasnella sp. 403]